MKRVATTFGLKDDYQYALYVGYVQAISSVGARVMPYSAMGYELPKGRDEIQNIAKSAVESCDAVMICGGLDVDPIRYNQERSSHLSLLDPARDELEISIIRLAIERQMKILAICRGMQILNVALGGSLHQDLESIGFLGHAIWDKEFEQVHPLSVVKGSRLSKVVGELKAVNSLHHQGIHELAPSLEASALGPSNTIEAVEAENIIGVQWHPERLYRDDQSNMALFEWLVS